MTNFSSQHQKKLSNASHSLLVATTNKTLAIVTICSISFAVTSYLKFNLDSSFLAVIGSSWVIALLLIYRTLRYHGHPKFGIANTVTTIRLAGAITLLGMLTIPHNITTTNTALWTISVSVALLIALDGVDGFFARREKLVSEFGARFDMEVDAFLALGIALTLWQTQRAEIWILGLGLMRYAFVVWSLFSPSLKANLFPSTRRKTVCVIQLSALCLMLSPLLEGSVFMLVGMSALVCLVASFAIDIHWLYKCSSTDVVD